MALVRSRLNPMLEQRPAATSGGHGTSFRPKTSGLDCTTVLGRIVDLHVRPRAGIDQVVPLLAFSYASSNHAPTCHRPETQERRLTERLGRSILWRQRRGAR